MAAQISSMLISSTKFLATPMEISFNSDYAVDLASKSWPFTISLVTAYVIFIFGAQSYMKDKEPFDLRLPLAFWNALLSVFSFIGMCRTVICFFTIFAFLFFVLYLIT